MHHLPTHPWLVHPRTGEPLRAVGFTRRGPIWPVMGGDGSEDDANEDELDDKSDDSEGDDKSDDEPDWKAKFEAEQRHKKNLERKARKDAATIQRLTGKKPEGGSKDDKKSDEQPDADKIRQEAREEAAREVLHSRVEDKIEAKARAFADPEDAMAILLRTNSHDDFLDDGKIDVEAITDALTELGEKKPRLLAQGDKKFGGNADQGPRKETKERPKSLGDAVTRAYSKR